MTIRKGEPWGSPIDRPPELDVVGSDAAVAEAFRRDATVPVGLCGGDLFRSLGSPGERAGMQRLPIDLMEVTVDDSDFIAAAHVVVRRGWWRGTVIAAMNVDHIGAWNVAPRAHPNDGRFDVVEVDPAMSIRHRWQARGRLAAGTHVPHPQISVRTATTVERSFARLHRVDVDGVHVADARSIAITVRPDAFAVLV